MEKKSKSKSTLNSSSSSNMDAKQIIDVLPSYISLYSSSSSSQSPSSPSPNPERSAILRWFATLSPPQRVAHLTIVDSTFTQLLLRMLSSLLTLSPHVTFFLLPDLPSREDSSLPTLLTRRSRGLLARVADFHHHWTRQLRKSLLLFSSNECLTSRSSSDSLDAVSFREGFVSEFDCFVETMDRVSDSGFLNGSNSDWGELGNDWPEMGWLKAKGYYSLEAFVANRVEVALRLAWVNGSNGGKKRGVKLKEKAKNAVGLGANVYWRKKGCVDWWERLDDATKRKVFRTVLGRAAKCLVFLAYSLVFMMMLSLVEIALICRVAYKYIMLYMIKSNCRMALLIWIGISYSVLFFNSLHYIGYTSIC